MLSIYQINCDESPKEVIAADFKLQLPIRGGWGYSQENACIIDKYDPLVDPSCPFNGVKVDRLTPTQTIINDISSPNTVLHTPLLDKI